MIRTLSEAIIIVEIMLTESIYKRGQIQAIKDETTLEDLMFVLLENYLDDWEPEE